MLPITDEEEDDDVLSMQEATVEVPRSSATKKKARKIFKTPPKKSVTGPSQPEVAPTNAAPWMQQQWLPVASSQQQQWMMGQANPWMMSQPGAWMLGQQFPGHWV
jgi:hypothetical protein